MYRCLPDLVLFQNYGKLIMLELDTVSVWGHHFRHNAYKAAIILVIACFYMYLCY